jgi:hypothetical protein
VRRSGSRKRGPRSVIKGTNPAVRPRPVRATETETETVNDLRPMPAGTGLIVCPGEKSGGYEIRTREGFIPTRFPSVRPRPLGESSAGNNTEGWGLPSLGYSWRQAPRAALPREPPQGLTAARISELWRVHGGSVRVAVLSGGGPGAGRWPGPAGTGPSGTARLRTGSPAPPGKASSRPQAYPWPGRPAYWPAARRSERP